NATIAYKWKISQTASFSADLNTGNYTNDQTINQPNSYFSTSKSLLREINNYFEPFTSIHFSTASMDYEKNIHRLKLGAGARYSHVSTSNDFIVSTLENGIIHKSIENSNSFNYL